MPGPSLPGRSLQETTVLPMALPTAPLPTPALKQATVLWGSSHSFERGKRPGPSRRKCVGDRGAPILAVAETPGEIGKSTS